MTGISALGCVCAPSGCCYRRGAYAAQEPPISGEDPEVVPNVAIDAYNPREIL